MPAEPTRQELLDEIAALKEDRAWEARRANEAARLSADARDQTDHLRKEVANLGEQVANLERQRLDRTVWALGVLDRHGISCAAEDDEFALIAKYLRTVTAERDHAREEWHRHNQRADEWRGRASRAEEVVEAATAWRAAMSGSLLTVPAETGLALAVDALDGVAPPCICNPRHRPDDPICQYREASDG